jgi:hypothetical protein
MDDVLEDNTTKLNCGHRFCNDCYQVREKAIMTSIC